MKKTQNNVNPFHKSKPEEGGRKRLVNMRPNMFSKQLYTKYNSNILNETKTNIFKKTKNNEKNENLKKNSFFEKNEKKEKKEKNENSFKKTEKTEKVEKTEKNENSFKKTEKTEKVEKIEKNENNENNENNEKVNSFVETSCEAYPWFSESSLFWTFYRLLNSDYEKSKMFQIKQNFCMKLLEQVKVNKGELKECKVKYGDFEQSLLYDKDINVETLKVLATIFKQNIIFVENIKYYIFFQDKEVLPSSFSFNLIKKRENYYNCEKIEKDKKDELLEQMKKTHFFVENVKKPINSASYYKLDEIKTIAKQLNLKLDHQNGKNKTKMELYQEISGCLLQN